MQERFEESPFYQMILERGHEEGLEEGIRKSLLKIVEAKYPDSDLPQLVKETTASLSTQDDLLNLLTQISMTTLPEEARAILLAATTDNNPQH